jgi:hypothetical protein
MRCRSSPDTPVDHSDQFRFKHDRNNDGRHNHIPTTVPLAFDRLTNKPALPVFL